MEKETSPKPTIDFSKNSKSPSGLEGVLGPLLEHRQAFHSFLTRRLGSDAFAEDLLQQCFIKALAHAHNIKHVDRVIPWFYRILRHALIDYYRTRETDAKRLQAFMDEIAVLDTNQVPSMDELQPTICACLDRLVLTLRPTYAELIRRIDLSGESFQSVAADLRLTTNNLTVRLHRARQALRRSLEQTCGICTKHGCLNCTCA